MDCKHRQTKKVERGNRWNTGEAFTETVCVCGAVLSTDYPYEAELDAYHARMAGVAE